jgi:hypothetical protein
VSVSPASTQQCASACSCVDRVCSSAVHLSSTVDRTNEMCTPIRRWMAAQFKHMNTPYGTLAHVGVFAGQSKHRYDGGSNSENQRTRSAVGTVSSEPPPGDGAVRMRGTHELAQAVSLVCTRAVDGAADRRSIVTVVACVSNRRTTCSRAPQSTDGTGAHPSDACAPSTRIDRAARAGVVSRDVGSLVVVGMAFPAWRGSDLVVRLGS